MKRIDLTGKRFSRLTIVEYAGTTSDGTVCWQCRCDCGKTNIVRGANLRNGHTKSCGCERRTVWNRPGIREKHQQACLAAQNRPERREEQRRTSRQLANRPESKERARQLGFRNRREGNAQWRGDEAGYDAAHIRIKVARGPASGFPCAHCGQQAVDWAFNHTAVPEIRRKYGTGTDKSRVYSLNVNDYLPLCKCCHKQFDSQVT